MARTDFGGKVRLGFSPYTYARVAVMKSALLRRIDYDRILKMGVQESLRFLQDTSYKQEMEEFNVSAEGIRNIEMALNANFMRHCLKLFKISDAKMKKVLATYLLRYDLENIKVILRSKFAHIKAEEVEPLFYGSVNFDKHYLKNLLSKQSVEEVLNSLDFLKKRRTNKRIQPLPVSASSGQELFDAENRLDRYYLETLSDFSGSLKGQGLQVAEFLGQEIEAVNIKTLIKLKHVRFPGNLQAYVVSPTRLVLALAGMNVEFNELVKYLHHHKYTSLTGDEKELLSRLEIDLDVSLLKKESLLMHRSLLSANYILGYLFAKEIEIRNLKAIIKGKKLGVDHHYLEQLLVIAK